MNPSLVYSRHQRGPIRRIFFRIAGAIVLACFMFIVIVLD